jgi:succinyl-CoA synthetase beta subunit
MNSEEIYSLRDKHKAVVRCGTGAEIFHRYSNEEYEELLNKNTECAYCHRPFEDGDHGEVGVVINGVGYSLCTYDCLTGFNLTLGLTVNNETIPPAEN